MAAVPPISYFQNNLLSKADTAVFKVCCDTHEGVNFGKCCTRDAAMEFSEKLLTSSIQINLKEIGGGVNTDFGGQYEVITVVHM
jgi:hypothetical protein